MFLYYPIFRSPPMFLVDTVTSSLRDITPALYDVDFCDAVELTSVHLQTAALSYINSWRIIIKCFRHAHSQVWNYELRDKIVYKQSYTPLCALRTQCLPTGEGGTDHFSPVKRL